MIKIYIFVDNWLEVYYILLRARVDMSVKPEGLLVYRELIRLQLNLRARQYDRANLLARALFFIVFLARGCVETVLWLYLWFR